MKTVLRATTWAHLRGLAPLAAAGQAYADVHGIGFQVETHSAATFGEGPLDELARRYDVIVFDHPLTGEAAVGGLFLPLDEHLPSDVLDDRRQHSVGASFESYVHEGKVYGLPHDAASIVAARSDTLSDAPVEWADVLALAHAGRVVQPFSRMSTTALFFTLCGGLGARLSYGEGGLVGLAPEVATLALERLGELYAHSNGHQRRQQGAIQVLGEVGARSDAVYVPACYGYSTYARPGIAPRQLFFEPTPLARAGAVLGGAGAAVSAFSAHREHALRFIAWATGADCQTHLHAVCAGQPAHAAAWEADLPNRLTENFYRRLRPAIEAAWPRPNASSFHHFQGSLATRLGAFLDGEVGPTALAREVARGG